MDSFNETKEFNQQKDTVILKPGQIAPNFNLAFTSNQKISLYDFRGVYFQLLIRAMFFC